MQAFYAQNLILIVNFSPIRTKSDKFGEFGEEISRRKMHTLKIPQHLEPQGFEGCERGIFRKLSSYYIHHFNSTKAKKKSGYNIPTNDKKKGWVYYTHRKNRPAGILYPPPKTKKRV